MTVCMASCQQNDSGPAAAGQIPATAEWSQIVTTTMPLTVTPFTQQPPVNFECHTGTSSSWALASSRHDHPATMLYGMRPVTPACNWMRSMLIMRTPSSGCARMTVQTMQPSRVWLENSECR